MTEKPAKKDHQANGGTNKGANDARLTPLNDEQQEVAMKGGKATPNTGANDGIPSSQQPAAANKDSGEGDKNRANADTLRQRQDSDNENDTRGGVMRGGTNGTPNQ